MDEQRLFDALTGIKDDIGEVKESVSSVKIAHAETKGDIKEMRKEIQMHMSKTDIHFQDPSPALERFKGYCEKHRNNVREEQIAKKKEKSRNAIAIGVLAIGAFFNIISDWVKSLFS